MSKRECFAYVLFICSLMFYPFLKPSLSTDSQEKTINKKEVDNQLNFILEISAFSTPLPLTLPVQNK